jgi:hypothetical protein
MQSGSETRGVRDSCPRPGPAPWHRASLRPCSTSWPWQGFAPRARDSWPCSWLWCKYSTRAWQGLSVVPQGDIEARSAIPRRHCDVRTTVRRPATAVTRNDVAILALKRRAHTQKPGFAMFQKAPDWLLDKSLILRVHSHPVIAFQKQLVLEQDRVTFIN